MIRENFPLEKLGIAQFMKIFSLENNLLYSKTIGASELSCLNFACIIYLSYITYVQLAVDYILICDHQVWEN